MAQLNITLDQEEILALLSKNHDGAFRKLLQACLNKVLLAESTEQLGVQPYERSEERKDSRNGTRERPLTLRIGTIVLTVPRHRNTPFKTMIFENYSRSEAALVAGMAEMVVNGVSTRKVEKVVQEICGTSFSKSTVSNLCKDLYKDVEAFRTRPLNGPYPFLTVDATYFKVRENHRIISKAFMIAYGTNSQGVRFSKNIAELAPKKYQVALRADLNALFQAKTMQEAVQKRDDILESYGDVAERAMKCLEDGFEDAMTVLLLPIGMRRFFRTSNHIERINRELKRRSGVIGVFPNETSLMRLIGSTLIELNEKRQAGKAVFSAKSYAEMMASNTPSELRRAAIRQQNMAAA